MTTFEKKRSLQKKEKAMKTEKFVGSFDDGPDLLGNPATNFGHRWSEALCSCGTETVICQGCGRPVCGAVAVWVAKRGNVGNCCFAKFGLGHAGLLSSEVPQYERPLRGGEVATFGDRLTVEEIETSNASELEAMYLCPNRCVDIKGKPIKMRLEDKGAPRCALCGRRGEEKALPLGLEDYPILGGLVKAGIVWETEGEWVGRAADGKEVLLGVSRQEDRVEEYLRHHSTPETW